jgi:hypothetical protein
VVVQVPGGYPQSATVISGREQLPPPEHQAEMTACVGRDVVSEVEENCPHALIASGHGIGSVAVHCDIELDRRSGLAGQLDVQRRRFILGDWAISG